MKPGFSQVKPGFLPWVPLWTFCELPVWMQPKKHVFFHCVFSVSVTHRHNYQGFNVVQGTFTSSPLTSTLKLLEPWKKGPWLVRVYRGWTPFQLYGDYNKPWNKDPVFKQPGFQWKVGGSGFFGPWLTFIFISAFKSWASTLKTTSGCFFGNDVIAIQEGCIE